MFCPNVDTRFIAIPADMSSPEELFREFYDSEMDK